LIDQCAVPVDERTGATAARGNVLEELHVPTMPHVPSDDEAVGVCAGYANQSSDSNDEFCSLHDADLPGFIYCVRFYRQTAMSVRTCE
jgi:hypothetical protein